MQRIIGPESRKNPLAHLFDHLGIIGIPGHHQIRHLKMNLLFMQCFESIQYRLQTAAVQFPVDGVAECLEIDIGGVQNAAQLHQRFWIDITVGNP